MKRVKDYVLRDISSVNEKSTLRRVIRTMRLQRHSVLPVENALGEYIGCITEQKILDAAIPDYIKSIYNTSFMADLDQISTQLQEILDHKATLFIDSKYPTVAPGDSMSYAADLLYRNKGSLLPVVEGKTLIGLITGIEILCVALDT
ncbi:MAG: CBS domain-containing protein [Bacteroidota bacterium]|nr:MAG: CBS domain-containing protein [Bacteroidota bacterium]